MTCSLPFKYIIRKHSVFRLKSGKRTSRDMNKGLNALDLGENQQSEKKSKPNPMHGMQYRNRKYDAFFFEMIFFYVR